MRSPITSLEEVLTEVAAFFELSNERVILAIIGKPGAGKSTITDHIFKNIAAEDAVLVPMDGYHLSNRILADLALADRKGAPETFDAQGFVSLMRRIKSDIHSDIYFPIFHRDLEESMAAEGVIKAGTKLIIVEGNYLLLQSSPWSEIAKLIDESWYLDLPETLRQERLISRHVAYGRSPQDAQSWALGSDERNAVIIGGTKKFASRIVALENRLKC